MAGYSQNLWMLGPTRQETAGYDEIPVNSASEDTREVKSEVDIHNLEDDEENDFAISEQDDSSLD